jgi:glycogen debranching enzyme
MAEALGRTEMSSRLRREAEELRERFIKAFWCADIGAYALALDGAKRPCRVRSSNAGQCLFTGIADEHHAVRVADLMLSEDMFTGFGVRTIASGEARYNPMSYHNGSVWPHDNALIALGLRRCGRHAEAGRILEGLFQAGLFMDQLRLPELFCGFIRRPGEGPTLYPVACNPQAWASGAPYMLLEACLGIQVDAKAERVVFHTPMLPPFLDDLRIAGLQAGSGSVDLVLRRHAEDVTIEITRRTGKLEIVETK